VSTLSHALRFATPGPPSKVVQYLPVQGSPPLGPGEVRLRMLAAPVNPADLNFIQGAYGRAPTFAADVTDTPTSPTGIEGCGRVEESRDPRFAEGQHVIVLRALGTWSEFLVARGDDLFDLHSDMPVQQAAMLKINPMTAWRMLRDFVALESGSWIALNAANSGVGRCVIQIARLMGWRTVCFVRNQSERVVELQSLGADLVFEDAGSEAYRAALGQLEGKRPVLALNAVGGLSAGNLLQILDVGGCMVTYGGMSLRNVQISTSQLIFRNLQARGFWLSHWLSNASSLQVAGEYARLSDWVASGKLVQAIDQAYPLADFQFAFARAQEPYRTGRVLFDMESSVVRP
jgi:mitochondrial enoyl-[acyl-carrier protein] reductase / trans-2-enoyl-CoA reductase